jgi:hypothetical protein
VEAVTEHHAPVVLDFDRFRAGQAVVLNGQRYRIKDSRWDESTPQSAPARLELMLDNAPVGESVAAVDLGPGPPDHPLSDPLMISGRAYEFEQWHRESFRIHMVLTRAWWRDESPWDRRERQYEAERDKLARAIHKRVQSSSISRTVPYMVGDAERAVAAVIMEGWTPPTGYVEKLTGFHYGPTETDPDPGHQWHYGCGQQVWYLKDGYICVCGQQWDDDMEPIPGTRKE